MGKINIYIDRLLTIVSLMIIIGLYNHLEASESNLVLPERVQVECRGGTGKAFYSIPPVCYKPYCDVGSNPAAGCLLASILVPPVDKDPVIPSVDEVFQTRTIVTPSYVCVLTCNSINSENEESK